MGFLRRSTITTKTFMVQWRTFLQHIPLFQSDFIGLPPDVDDNSFFLHYEFGLVLARGKLLGTCCYWFLCQTLSS